MAMPVGLGDFMTLLAATLSLIAAVVHWRGCAHCRVKGRGRVAVKTAPTALVAALIGLMGVTGCGSGLFIAMHQMLALRQFAVRKAGCDGVSRVGPGGCCATGARWPTGRPDVA